MTHTLKHWDGKRKLRYDEYLADLEKHVRRYTSDAAEGFVELGMREASGIRYEHHPGKSDVNSFCPCRVFR
jgi:hypothetical protein